MRHRIGQIIVSPRGNLVLCSLRIVARGNVAILALRMAVCISSALQRRSERFGENKH
jgi:hypothetical protein